MKKQGFHVVGRDPTDEERLKYPLIAKFKGESGGYNAQRTKMDLPISLSVIDAVTKGNQRSGSDLADIGREFAAFDYYGDARRRPDDHRPDCKL